MSDNFFLTEGIPGDESVTITPPTTPFQITKITATYSRTMQVKQYEPLNPVVTVEVDVRDPNAVTEAIKIAMREARNAVRAAFALAVPSVMVKMEEEYINEFIDLSNQAQRALILKRINGGMGEDDQPGTSRPTIRL